VDEYRIDQALQAFELIESKIVEFSKHVPIIVENERIESPSLIPVIINACGLIDSLFRDKTPDPITIEGRTKAREECNIYDFAHAHATSLDLPNTRSVLLVSPPRYLTPFKSWETLLTGTYSPLPWWQDYNDLKHDWLLNIEKGTLGTALQATCALHQVITRRSEFVRFLLRRGWLSSEQYPVDYLLEAIPQGRVDCVVQTRLFATPLGKRQFPEDVSEIEAGFYTCKKEFVEFLGRVFGD